MQLALHNASGADAGTLEVSDVAFDAKFNETLVHQAVTAYMAGARAGTKAQKTRSDVRGGGAKSVRRCYRSGHAVVFTSLVSYPFIYPDVPNRNLDRIQFFIILYLF